MQLSLAPGRIQTIGEPADLAGEVSAAYLGGAA